MTSFYYKNVQTNEPPNPKKALKGTTKKDQTVSPAFKKRIEEANIVKKGTEKAVKDPT